MLDGKVEGCILEKDIVELLDEGIVVFRQTVDLEEFSGERMEITIANGTVNVIFNGVEMECPKEHCRIDLE